MGYGIVGRWRNKCFYVTQCSLMSSITIEIYNVRVYITLSVAVPRSKFTENEIGTVRRKSAVDMAVGKNVPFSSSTAGKRDETHSGK